MQRGEIVLINKHENNIEYFVEYESEVNIRDVPSVTQVKLWRQTTGYYSPGITKEIFFDVLLKKWDIIASDKQQTPKGRDFWLTRMAEAARLGHYVGVRNHRDFHIDWFDNTTSWHEWINKYYKWGKSADYQSYRYVIATKKFYQENL